MQKLPILAETRKAFTFVLLLLHLGEFSFSQKPEQRMDFLITELTKADNDGRRLELYAEILEHFSKTNLEEGLEYEKPALQLARKLNSKPRMAEFNKNLGRIYYNLGRFEEAARRHLEALTYYEQLKDEKGMGSALTWLGKDYADGGNYPKGMEYFSRALKIAEDTGNLESQAYLHSVISWVYVKMGNFPEATQSNLASLKIYEKTGDKNGIAIATSNIAGYYIKIENYTEALEYLAKSAEAFLQSGDGQNRASVFIDIGNAHEKMGNFDEALKNYNQSIDISASIGNDFQVALAQQFIGGLYESRGKYEEALGYYTKAAQGFRHASSNEQLAFVLNSAGICFTRLQKYKEAEASFSEARKLLMKSENPLALSEFYGGREILDSALGNWKEAYFNYKLHILKRDSIYNEESHSKSLQLNMQYNFDKKEAAAIALQEKKDALAAADLNRQKMLRNGFLLGFAIMLLFAGIFFFQRNRIKKGKQRSEELLLNILPAEVADELKIKGRADAKHFDQVSVLFTDFKNFTKVSEHLSPQDLVNIINFCYIEFDKIITSFGIEKIKTIGDAYMCAGGLPVPNNSNAEDTVRAALAIRKFMESEKQKREAEGKPFFEIRIGIHTGPVVAGIVGIKKFAYDIWGDTVNIASRMESSGEPGKINISSTTYELVKDKFICSYRGKIHAKNKGEVDMYYVESPLKEI